MSDPPLGEGRPFNMSTELYGPVLGQSPLIDNLFLKLKKNLDAELKLLEEMTQVKGALDMIFALSALSA